MSLHKSFAKDTSNGGHPYLAEQNVPYAAGAGHPGVSVQMKRITQVGASPYTVSFAEYGMKDMDDAFYYADAVGTGAGVVTQASRTTSSLVITGGANADVYALLIVGPILNQTVA